MEKYAVYWQSRDDDIDVVFFPTKQEAVSKIFDLIKQYEDTLADGDPRCSIAHWDITLLQVIGEVYEEPDGYHIRQVT